MTNTQFSKRRALVLGIPAAIVWPLTARAQTPSYPNKAVKVLVPFVAGGSSDIVARAIANHLQQSLGQPFLAENRPGANGSIAADMLRTAPPDGYTLLVGSIGVFSINESLYKDIKYKSLRDFEPVTLAVTTPNVLVVHPKFPANNVNELVEYAKKNPGKVTYGSSGSGSSDHLSAELFKIATKTFGVHIPYRGGAAAQTDLMGGQIDASFQNMGAVTQYIKSGRMKALAVTSAQRMPQLPDVPTMVESGGALKDFVVTSWQAVMAPKGTPKDIIAKLQIEIAKGLNAPELKARFTAQGFDVVANSPDAYGAFLKAELDRWKLVVDRSGAKPD